jgi:hypothetical protein
MSTDRGYFLKTTRIAGPASLLPFGQVLADSMDEQEGLITTPAEQGIYLITGRQAAVTIMVDKARKTVNSMCFSAKTSFPAIVSPYTSTSTKPKGS